MNTVHLGQFTDENADALTEALERAGIFHWEKRPGRWTRLLFAGEWGVRVFVDADRAQEAQRIATRITGKA